MPSCTSRAPRPGRPVAGLLLVLSSLGTARAQQTARVSVDATGAQSNGLSQNPRISADGRFVVFESDASNLVACDDNGTFDVFVKELATGAIELVSVSSAGTLGNDASQVPAISADGRFVAFESLASNLVAGDGNGQSDVFLRDRQAGTTVRASVSSAGVEANLQSHRASVSADGRFVAFDSPATNLSKQDQNGVDVFRRDTVAGVTLLISVASSGAAAFGSSARATLSSDGNLVAFESDAGNLTSDDDNGTTDVFVRDVNAGTTTCVSVDPAGATGDFGGWNAAISADGSAVAFVSTSTDLVAGDTNTVADVFVRDLAAAVTERVSVATGGGEGNGRCDDPAISADATRVGFSSESDDLVDGDTNGTWDVFVHERALGWTTRSCLSSANAEGDYYSDVVSLSGDGALVAFQSSATTLVANDTNATSDVFTRSASPATSGNYGAGWPGTLGEPALAAPRAPVVGLPLEVDAGNSSGSWTVGVLLVGFAPASLDSGRGGTLLVDFRFCVPIVLGPAGSSTAFATPRDDRLDGVSAYMQAIELDPGASAGLAFTAGLALQFGF